MKKFEEQETGTKNSEQSDEMNKLNEVIKSMGEKDEGRKANSEERKRKEIMRNDTNRYLNTIEELETEKNNMKRNIIQLEENNKEIMKINKMLGSEIGGQRK